MKNKLLFLLIAVLFVITSFSGCFEQSSKTDEQKSEPGEVIYTDLTLESLNILTDDFPNIGSSTSAHPLAVLIGCKVLNMSYIWVIGDMQPYEYGYNTIFNKFLNITNRFYYYDFYGYYDTENFLLPNVSETDKLDIAENITNKIQRTGTHGSYVELINGTLDLIIVARLPSDDELEMANNYSVDLVTKPIALDAFVFILNQQNIVDSLTVEQIQKIYTGEYLNWSSIGGNDSEINAYIRNDNSGSHELMKALVMNDLDMIDETDMIQYTMMGPYNRLTMDTYGIAYSVYYYKQFMSTFYHNVNFCGVNGIMPDYNNISSKSYPYTTEVYVVIKKDLDTNSPAYKIRDWLLGIDGQEVVKESGYVPIS